MSTYLDEKLAKEERAYGSKARCKFHHLKVRFGARGLEGVKKAPARVEVESRLGVEVEVWKRVDNSTGLDAVYELEETIPNVSQG